jgi:pantetheine-phosphate adenylyltransferase
MSNSKAIRAVFPGVFDPVTNGHLDIIERGRHMFDELIVMVGKNPEKEALFLEEERVEMLRELVQGMGNVTVDLHTGLTWEFVKSRKSHVILRGIRDGVDLRSELMQANTNRIVGDVETVFLVASTEHALTSSTLIKQVVSMGGFDADRLTRLVPPLVAEKLKSRLGGGS